MVLLTVQACAPLPSTSARDPVTMLHRQPLGDDDMARLGRVGVATVAYQSLHDTPENSILDTARDVMHGAVGGAAGGAVVVLMTTCFIAPFSCLAAAPLAAGGAVVGATAGVVGGVPKDHGRQPEGDLETRVTQRLFAETVQNDLTTALAAQGARAHGREILRVDRLDPDSGRPRAPGDSEVRQGVDTLIDARITALVLERSGEHRIRPVLYTRAWVVNVAAGDTLGDSAYSVAGQEMNAEDLDEQGEVRLIEWARSAGARVASYYVVDIFGRLGPGTSVAVPLPYPEPASGPESAGVVDNGIASGSPDRGEAATSAHAGKVSGPETQTAPDAAAEAAPEAHGEKRPAQLQLLGTVLDLLQGSGDRDQARTTNTTGPQPGELP